MLENFFLMKHRFSVLRGVDKETRDMKRIKFFFKVNKVQLWNY